MRPARSPRPDAWQPEGPSRPADSFLSSRHHSGQHASRYPNRRGETVASRSERAPLRVAVLADDNLARSGLAAALAREPGLVIAGQWSTHDASFARSVHPQAGVW